MSKIFRKCPFVLRSTVGELLLKMYLLPQNYSGEKSINEERTVFKDGNKFEKYHYLI